MIYLPIAGALLSLVSAVFVNETATSENTQMVWPFGGTGMGIYACEFTSRAREKILALAHSDSS